MKVKVFSFLMSICFFCLQNVCAQKNKNVIIKHTDSSRIVIGNASYYSKSLEGSKTATGGTFHHKKFTGASNFFALGTWVKVTRLATDDFVFVYINDHTSARMAKKGRVIDLSHAAAAKLNFLLRGVTKVKVESVRKEIANNILSTSLINKIPN